MSREPSAAHVVVVHAGKVVVHEGVRMHDLYRRRDSRRIPGSSGRPVCGKNKERPKSLPATRKRVPHSVAHLPLQRPRVPLTDGGNRCFDALAVGGS
jgi:hypothetical protein